MKRKIEIINNELGLALDNNIMTVVISDAVTNETNTFRNVINARYDKDLFGVYLTLLNETGSTTSFRFEDTIILEVRKGRK